MEENKLYIEPSIADNLPSAVVSQLAAMPADKQALFVEEYERRKKSVGMAYFFLLICFGAPYGYLGKWGWQIVYWITGFGAFLWFLILLFSLPSQVHDYNRDVAMDIMKDLRIMGLGDGNANRSESRSEESASESKAHSYAQKSGSDVCSFPKEKIEEILANESIYNPKLVAACREELELRTESEKFAEFAESKTDDELREIIGNSDQYNPAMVRRCSDVMNARIAKAEEEERQRQEEERLRLEEEERQRLAKEEEERLAEEKRQAELWAKWRIPVFILIGALAVLIFVLVWTSDNNRYKRAMNNLDNPDKAIALLKKVHNPKSGSFCSAKYNLGELLYEKGDYQNAKNAYDNLIILKDWRSNGWDNYDVYIAMTQHLRVGSRDKAIELNEETAADILKLSPQNDDRMTAGILYYNLGLYEEALEVLSPLEIYYDDETVSGYLGLMHCYGLGGLEPDAEIAWNYLDDAPDIAAFAVVKGDLTLFLNKGYSPLTSAKNYYEMAFAAYPDRGDIKYRYEILDQVCKVMDKHEGTGYWSRGTVYWDSYDFESSNGNNGHYYGEMMDRGQKRGAHGWGTFYWDNKERQIGHYDYLNRSGKNMLFLPAGGSYYLQVGEYSADKFKKGYTVSRGKVSEENL